MSAAADARATRAARARLDALRGARDAPTAATAARALGECVRASPSSRVALAEAALPLLAATLTRFGEADAEAAAGVASALESFLVAAIER
jgi:hypothetical protein